MAARQPAVARAVAPPGAYRCRGVEAARDVADDNGRDDAEAGKAVRVLWLAARQAR